MDHRASLAYTYSLYISLSLFFYQQVTQRPRAGHPLIIFIDSLDQLDASHGPLPATEKKP